MGLLWDGDRVSRRLNLYLFHVKQIYFLIVIIYNYALKYRYIHINRHFTL